MLHWLYIVYYHQIPFAQLQRQMEIFQMGKLFDIGGRWAAYNLFWSLGFCHMDILGASKFSALNLVHSNKMHPCSSPMLSLDFE
jgi:hypothetical protein